MSNYSETPAGEMLPTPFIVEDLGGRIVNEVVEKHRIAVINEELQFMMQGIDPKDLAVGSLYAKYVESGQESVIDPLTGLLNRKGMELWYERYCPEVFGIIFADGRNFKRINDTYGHDTGDDVIRNIGEKMSDKFRIGKPDEEQIEKRADPETKDAVGLVRWSGDEFMMILDLSSVPPEKRQETLDMLRGRLYNFGEVTDSRTGEKIQIQIDSAGTIGYKKDQKTLKDYREQLDLEVSDFKAKRGRTR